MDMTIKEILSYLYSFKRVHALITINAVQTVVTPENRYEVIGRLEHMRGSKVAKFELAS